jgi:hypothetical protein
MYYLWILLLVGLTLPARCFSFSTGCSFLGSAEWIGSKRQSSSRCRTRRFLFGNDQGKKKEETNSKDKKKKNEPFVFLIGKPQYDWVTGKTEYNRKERVNWLYKPTTKEKDSARKNTKKEK